MHPSKAFLETDRDRLAALVEETGLAAIIACSDRGPLAAHAPVLLRPDRLWFHLSKANALCDALGAGGEALALVTGPDAYVSPDWYGTADQVPTWNYVSAEIADRCDQ